MELDGADPGVRRSGVGGVVRRVRGDAGSDHDRGGSRPRPADGRAGPQHHQGLRSAAGSGALSGNGNSIMLEADNNAGDGANVLFSKNGTLWTAHQRDHRGRDNFWLSMFGSLLVARQLLTAQRCPIVARLTVDLYSPHPVASGRLPLSPGRSRLPRWLSWKGATRRTPQRRIRQ